MIKSKLGFSWLVCLTAVFVGGVASYAQQSSRGNSPRPNLNRAADEASQILRNAGQSAQDEEKLQSRDSKADTGRIQQLMSEAKQAVGGDNTSPQDAAGDAKLNAAIESVTGEEGKTLLAQNNKAPNMRAPDSDKVVPSSNVTPADIADAKPEAIKPTPLDAPAKKEPVRTVITSEGAAYFDSKQAMGVFTDDVIVNHPQFHITCDTLEVYMLKDGEAPAPAPTRPAGTLPGEEPANTPDSSVKQAIAKGRKVVIQKMSETGELQIGICRHATYVGATGDIIMRDYPQVQRGRNVVIATDASTVMTIKPTGELRTQGPNRVDIIQQDANDKKGAPGSAPTTGGTSNGASVKPASKTKLQGAS